MFPSQPNLQAIMLYYPTKYRLANCDIGEGIGRQSTSMIGSDRCGGTRTAASFVRRASKPCSQATFEVE
jgi:hypothetical protein